MLDFISSLVDIVSTGLTALINAVVGSISGGPAA